MPMRIDEAGHKGCPAKITLAGPGAGCVADLGARANGQDTPIAHRHSLGLRNRIINRDDLRIQIDHGACATCLSGCRLLRRRARGQKQSSHSKSAHNPEACPEWHDVSPGFIPSFAVTIGQSGHGWQALRALADVYLPASRSCSFAGAA